MRIVAIDTESCDGCSYDGSLCSIGYCVFDENFNIIEQKDILINPLPETFKLSAYGKAPAINLGYSEATFRAAPRFSGVYDEAKRLFDGDTLVVGFSFNNDISYLNDACDKFGLERFDFKYIDAQKIYALMQGNKKQVALSTIADEYGITFTEHRSDEDAKATGLILKRFLEIERSDVNGLLQKYEIILGENGSEPKYADSGIYVRQKYDKTLKPVKKILIDEYRSGLVLSGGKKRCKYSGKTICFAEDIEYADADEFRSLLSHLYSLGIKTVRDVGECNVFVKKEDAFGERYQKAVIRKDAGEGIVIIAFDELIAIIGDYETLTFDDDETVLKEYYERTALRKKQKALLKKQYGEAKARVLSEKRLTFKVKDVLKRE